MPNDEAFRDGNFREIDVGTAAPTGIKSDRRSGADPGFFSGARIKDYCSGTRIRAYSGRVDPEDLLWARGSEGLDMGAWIRGTCYGRMDPRDLLWACYKAFNPG